MDKFELIQKVFNKLKIDYPSPKVLSSLKIVNVSPKKFLDVIVESSGGKNEAQMFFSFYLNELEKNSPQGFFVDLSKYYGPGSFITVKFGKVDISSWGKTEESIVEVKTFETESRIVLDQGTYSLSNLFDDQADLGTMNEILEFQESISNIISYELQKYLGVPFYTEL
jgi:hypothetical protein